MNRDWKVVSVRDWREMLLLGFHHDVSKGGVYDSRTGAINVWATPNDHPASWAGVVITLGLFPEPPWLLGGIETDWDRAVPEGHIALALSCTPYGRHELAVSYPLPNEDEWAWLEEKAAALFAMAQDELEPLKNGVYCRFCDGHVKVAILNDFVAHIVNEHNLPVSCIVIGHPTYLVTPIGNIELG